MPNFRFGQNPSGNVYSLQDKRKANATSRQHTVSANPMTQTATQSAGGRASTVQTGYQVERFNPAYDRLEEGSVIEDWIPRDLPGINKMLRIIYTRDAICGPATDIMSFLPWSEYDLQGVDDPYIMRFFEEASQLFGDKAQEMPAITIEYLALGRFCASLIYNETKGYWDDFVAHDSDFLTITPIPVRNFDPKIDLMLSPGMREFISSMDYRDKAAMTHIPAHLIAKMRSGQPLPLDPLNTLYLRRKSSPYDFVGTSLYCVTGDTLVNTSKGLIRIDELHDEVIEPCEIEKQMVVATTNGETAKTSHWVYSGDAFPVEIITENGYGLSGTDDHPVLTLNEETLDTEFKTLKDVNVDDLVAIDYKSELWPQEVLVLDDVIADLPKRGRAVAVELPRVMTNDLALILGYLASEGHVNRRIEFGNTDEEVVEDFRQAWGRVFSGSVLTDREGNKDIPLLTCYSVKILDFFKALFGGHTSTYDKEVPWVILQSTREHAASFLSGLFEGDGSTAKDFVNLYSISETMLKQVQVLLLKFGILSHRPDPEGINKRRANRDDCCGECSLLQVSGVFKDKLIDEIGFRSSFKKRFDEVQHNKCDLVRLKAGKFVEAVADERRVERRGRGWYTNDDGEEVRVSIAYDIQRDSFDSLRTDKQENLAKISKSAAEKIKEVEEQGYFWSRIRHKKKLYEKQKVYDLCVPETEAFIGNGIAQHNTRIIPFWALEKALMNATVTAARRRAGNILHVTIGLDDKWEPTQAEMEDIAGLFIQADEDPVGAVVATRTGVEANEIRDAGSLWKWSDEWSTFAEGKMRGLGISEALLAGDACMVGETLIATDQGLLEIGSLKNPRKGKWQDLDLTVASHNGPAKAVKWFYNGIKPTLKVETDLGHELQCTYNHPFLVLDGLDLVWKRADSLKTGDQLCVPTKQITRRNPLELHLPKPKSVRKTIIKDVKQPEIMTPELAYLIGLIVTEGTMVSSQSRIAFANSDKKLLSRYENLMKSVFGLDCSKKKCSGGSFSKKTCWLLETYSKTLIEWLEYLGLYCGPSKNGKTPSYYKIIPWSILQADERSQLAFIAGFLEGDGSISKIRRMIFSSVSKKMIEQMQIMLAAHGIIAPRIKDGIAHRVTVGNRESIELWEKINPYVASKTFRTKKLNNRQHFGIPNQCIKNLLKERRVKGVKKTFVDDAGDVITTGVYDKSTHDAIRYKKILYDKFDRGDYKAFLSDLKKISASTHRALGDLLALRYKFTAVVSIKADGEKPVFDLTMDPKAEPAFVSNSLMIHNTYNNMEQARSVFTEQIRTLRSHLTSQVYYKLFKTLSRAHGFVKRKKADLDHRVRTNDSDGKQKFKINDYGQEEFQLEHLAQDEAMEIPEDELITPTMHWRKSLLPEGDREYLEMLEMLKEQGIPIPLKVWAARAGYDLNEAVGMLAEDKELRAKIKKDSGDDEGEGGDDAWGEAESDTNPYWDASDRFMQLKKSDARVCLQSLVDIVHQPGNKTVLADTGFIVRHVANHMDGNQRKVELMSYVLMRLGVAQSLPVSEETMSDIAGFFATDEYIPEKKRATELHYVAKISSTVKISKITDGDMDRIASSALKIVAKDGTLLRDNVSTAIKSKTLAPGSPTLFSGSTR